MLIIKEKYKPLTSWKADDDVCSSAVSTTSSSSLSDKYEADVGVGLW